MVFKSRAVDDSITMGHVLENEHMVRAKKGQYLELTLGIPGERDESLEIEILIKRCEDLDPAHPDHVFKLLWRRKSEEILHEVKKKCEELLWPWNKKTSIDPRFLRVVSDFAKKE